MSSFSTRFFFSVVWFAFLCWTVSGCREEEVADPFVATMLPFEAIVEPVAGEPVGVLIPSGASPHTYEPRPSDARRAVASTVLFYGSEDLDGWAAALESRARVSLLGLVPDSMKVAPHGVAGVDPHFWMDPLAVSAMLPALADTLCNFAPAGCDGFRANAVVFASDLAVVHDSISVMMVPVEGTPVILAHSFLQYFADRYGLRIVGVIEEMAGSEPSPRDMQQIVATARGLGARAVFTMPQHSARAAEAVARAADIPLVELDPLGGADDFRNLLYFNARKIREALVDQEAQP